jgi:hypothetical protein
LDGTVGKCVWLWFAGSDPSRVKVHERSLSEGQDFPFEVLLDDRRPAGTCEPHGFHAESNGRGKASHARSCCVFGICVFNPAFFLLYLSVFFFLTFRQQIIDSEKKERVHGTNRNQIAWRIKTARRTTTYTKATGSHWKPLEATGSHWEATESHLTKKGHITHKEGGQANKKKH